MSERPENTDLTDDDSVWLDRLAQNSKTRRERLDAAKASFDELLTGAGQKVVEDKRPMFDVEPAKPPTPAAIDSEKSGLQVPAFRAAGEMPIPSPVVSPQRKRKRRRLKKLLSRKRKKVFF